MFIALMFSILLAWASCWTDNWDDLTLIGRQCQITSTKQGNIAYQPTICYSATIIYLAQEIPEDLT